MFITIYILIESRFVCDWGNFYFFYNLQLLDTMIEVKNTIKSKTTPFNTQWIKRSTSKGWFHAMLQYGSLWLGSSRATLIGSNNWYWMYTYHCLSNNQGNAKLRRSLPVDVFPLWHQGLDVSRTLPLPTTTTKTVLIITRDTAIV